MKIQIVITRVKRKKEKKENNGRNDEKIHTEHKKKVK